MQLQKQCTNVDVNLNQAAYAWKSTKYGHNSDFLKPFLENYL